MILDQQAGVDGFRCQEQMFSGVCYLALLASFKIHMEDYPVDFFQHLPWRSLCCLPIQVKPESYPLTQSLRMALVGALASWLRFGMLHRDGLGRGDPKTQFQQIPGHFKHLGTVFFLPSSNISGLTPWCRRPLEKMLDKAWQVGRCRTKVGNNRGLFEGLR